MVGFGLGWTVFSQGWLAPLFKILWLERGGGAMSKAAYPMSVRKQTDGEQELGSQSSTQVHTEHDSISFFQASPSKDSTTSRWIIR